MSKGIKTTKPALTFGRLRKEYATDEACKALLAQLRWPDGKITCPRCHSEKVYKTSQAFRWKCKGCNKDGYRFSVLTGSVFENTNVPLKTWFEVALLMVSSKRLGVRMSFLPSPLMSASTTSRGRSPTL